MATELRGKQGNYSAMDLDSSYELYTNERLPEEVADQ